MISCPRVPPTSSPAPSAPVAWIATANGKAAPPTTSKAVRLFFPRLNLVSVHGHGTSRGQLLFLLEEGPSLWKGMGMKDSTPGGHTGVFFFILPLHCKQEGASSTTEAFTAPWPPTLFHIKGKRRASKPSSAFYPFLHLLWLLWARWLGLMSPQGLQSELCLRASPWGTNQLIN